MTLFDEYETRRLAALAKAEGDAAGWALREAVQRPDVTLEQLAESPVWAAIKGLPVAALVAGMAAPPMLTTPEPKVPRARLTKAALLELQERVCAWLWEPGRTWVDTDAVTAGVDAPRASVYLVLGKLAKAHRILQRKQGSRLQWMGHDGSVAAVLAKCAP